MSLSSFFAFLYLINDFHLSPFLHKQNFLSRTFNLCFKTLITLPTKEDTWGISSGVAQAWRGPASRATSLRSQVTDGAIDGHVEGEHVVCEEMEREESH
ncbi:hypothetical protein VNO80_06777 [Phaseolus coccineus]|uniref:Uncharacterized protein n=1 Tax=Phaseolus coccineus TaxID=3886 RepID=A0AAN9RHW7_PHACN